MRNLFLTLCSVLLVTYTLTGQVISNDTVTTCTGTLYDTGGPAGQYGAFEAFQYSICPSDPHGCISINLLSYDTEPIFDNLTIYDGPDIGSPVVAAFNGASTMPEFYNIPTTGCVTIGFNSDGGVFGDGFELEWFCSPGGCPTPPPDFQTCSGTFYDSGGPNGDYSNGEDITTIICPDADSIGYCVTLNFTEFDVETGFEQLTIYDGPTDASPQIGAYTGTGSPGVITATDSCLTVVFTSDGSVTNPGWAAGIVCAPCGAPPPCLGTTPTCPLPDACDIACDLGTMPSPSPCPGAIPATQTFCVDNIGASPAMPFITQATCLDGNDMPNPAADVWYSFTASSNEVTIDILSFLNAASVALYEGSNCGALTPLVCDNSTNGGVSIFATGIQPGDTYYIQISGEDANDQGEITMDITTSTDCYVPIIFNLSCPDTFYDSGGPAGDYSNGENTLTQICPDPDSVNQCVVLNFTSFDVENNFEQLTIYDGPDQNSPIIGIYTGTTSPGTIIAGGGCLTVLFTSDGSVTNPGWAADVICVECGTIPPCIGTTPTCATLPDACPTACDLGTLNAPTPCPGSSPAQQTFCIDNIGATAELPYSAQLACDDGNPMPNPSADVWYSFTASSNEITIDIQSELNAASVGLYQGTGCTALQPLGCNNSTNGNVSLFVPGIQSGSTYYVQISGEDENDQGEINLIIESSNNCDFCLISASLIASPTPNNGTYGPNQTVTFCFTVTEWSQFAANWFHAVVPEIGTGWDINTLNPTVIPPSCDGNGTWLWQQDITGTNTSSANVGTVGPGFVYDSGSGGPLDGNGENNFGDNCSGAVNWEFCWEITTNDCPPGMNGETLNVEVESYGDSETGSWGGAGCENDLTYTNVATLLCCVPPTVSVDVPAPDCDGNGGNSITLDVVGATPPYTYTWSDANIGNIPNPTGLTGGLYSVTIEDAQGCGVTETIQVLGSGTPFDVEITTPDDTICLGESITITATGASDYLWEPDGQTTPGITVSPTMTTTYIVNGSSIAGGGGSGGNLIENGDFEMGNTGFTSDYASTGAFTQGEYLIVDNAQNWNPNYAPCVDHTTGLGNMMAVDGAVIAGQNVWCQTVPVMMNTDYDFSAWLQSTYFSSPANIELTINGVTVGAGFPLTTITCDWAEYTETWNSGTSTTAEICLLSTSTAGLGNDFALDDISFTGPSGVLCEDSDTITIFVSQVSAQIIAQTDDGCNPGCDGSITVEVSDPVGAATYQWDDPAQQTTATATGLCAGTYNVTVTDDAGCTAVAQTTIAGVQAPTVSVQVSSTTCGEDNGAIVIVANGGVPPYQYSIDGGTTFGANDTYTFLAAGTYNIVVEDASGCQAATVANVLPSNTPSINTAGTIDTSCGEDNGTIYISVTGGVPNYQYSIDGGATFQNTSAFPNLAPGTYDIIVEDAIGCTDEAQVIIAPSTPPQIDFADLDDPSSCGSFDGAIEIFASGGTPPLQYSNNNGMAYQPSPVFTGLGANTYNLVVMDAAGCYDTLIVDLIDPMAPVIDTVLTVNPMCGEEDGFIEILLESGTGNPNFEYSIDNGVTFQGSNTFADLPDGIYEIIVEDFFGCRVTAQVELFQAGGPIITSMDISNATCGDDNAIITVSAAGGTMPYEYSIDGVNYQTGATFTNIAPGQYTLIVRDAAGCEVEDIAIITTDGEVIISVTTTDPSACNVLDGSILINANGGTPPYEFSINNGMSYQNSGFFDGLSPNTFNVVVQDVNGCLATTIVDLNAFNEPIIDTIDITDAKCSEDDGVIDIAVSGGTPNYEYSIDGGMTFQGIGLFDSLAAGIYDIVVTDFNGCQVTDQAIINGADAPEITGITAKDPLCGDMDGSIIITALGGTPALNYSIDGGATFQNNSTFIGLGAGIYDIVLQDAAGCEAFEQVILTDAGALVIDNIDTEESLCDGGNGEVTITVSGGTMPYQYSVDNGQNFQSGNVFAGLVPDVYNVLIEDANGCQASQQLTLISAGVPELDSIALTPTSCGETDGVLELFVIGGTPAYQYSIDGGSSYQADNLFENLASGTYDIVVEDFNGCQVMEQVEIFPTMAAVPMIIADGPTSFCFYESVNLYAGEFESYLWSTGDTTSTINTSLGGTYLVTVTDAQGCTGVAQQMLNVVPPYTVLAGDDQTIEIGDSYDVNVEFPNPDITYTWEGSDGSSFTGSSFSAEGLEAGTITYIVTASQNGCEVTDEVVIIIVDSSTWSIPNAFSPNDDGLNDTFGPITGGTIQVTTFKIFNRWGEKVHDDPNSRWDGSFRGSKQVSDVYIYMILLTTFEGETVELTGDVMLMK